MSRRVSALANLCSGAVTGHLVYATFVNPAAPMHPLALALSLIVSVIIIAYDLRKPTPIPTVPNGE